MTRDEALRKMRELLIELRVNLPRELFDYACNQALEIAYRGDEEAYKRDAEFTGKSTAAYRLYHQTYNQVLDRLVMEATL